MWWINNYGLMEFMKKENILENKNFVKKEGKKTKWVF